MNTQSEVCVCVEECLCVCRTEGVNVSESNSLTCPSVLQVGDFVSFPLSDPQSIDTQLKPNMHMLSSFDTQQSVSWLL